MRRCWDRSSRSVGPGAGRRLEGGFGRHRPPPAPKRVLVGAGPDFGTETHIWQAIPASDFDPDTVCGSGCTDFATTWNSQGGVLSFRRYVTDGQPRLFASPRLPGGARLTDIEYDYCDNNGSGRLFFLVYLCDFKGHCNDPAYHTHTSTAGEGCVAVVYSNLAAYTVDNLHSRSRSRPGGVSATRRSCSSPASRSAMRSRCLPRHSSRRSTTSRCRTPPSSTSRRWWRRGSRPAAAAGTTARTMR